MARVSRGCAQSRKRDTQFEEWLELGYRELVVPTLIWKGLVTRGRSRLGEAGLWFALLV